MTIVHARRRDARALRPPLEQARPSRHGPPHAATGAVVGAGMLAFGKRAWEHKVATAATMAMVGTMTAWPMTADLPELVPPPIAAPPPLEVLPDLPAPEPQPPEPEAEPPAAVEPAQAEAPEMEPVAVEQPALPELPAAPIPRATPPAPIPAPEPSPEPTVPPMEPPDDPGLLCYDLDLLGLVRLDLCLLP